MSFFKKKTSSADANRSKNGSVAKRGQMEMLASSEGTTQLAFGLRWVSVVTSGGRPAAIKVVKQNKGTHLLYRGQQFGFGTAPADVIKADPPVSIFPAAAVAARQFGGNAIHAIKIGDGEYWFAVIRNGQPTSDDDFIRADSDSVIVQEVERVVNTAHEEGTSYEIYTNLDLHDLGPIKRNSAEDLLMAAISDDDVMTLIPKKSVIDVPKPIMYAIIAVFSLIAVSKGWEYKKKVEAQKLAEANRPLPSEPPEIAWGRAISDWEQTKAKPDPNGLVKVRQSLGEVPVSWYGWDLDVAVCNAGEINVAAKKRIWSCLASYKKTKLSKTNEEMSKLVPENWSLSYSPMDKLNANWSIQDDSEPIKISELQPSIVHLTETASVIQKLLPTFNQVSGFAFANVEIPAPKKPDGTAYGPDPLINGFKSANLTLDGPLRSIDKLSQAGLPILWTSISLRSPSIEKLDPGINTSALTANASGVIYAKDK